MNEDIIRDLPYLLFLANGKFYQDIIIPVELLAPLTINYKNLFF